MTYSDLYFHEKLSALPGETRELFLEKSTDTTFRIVNGRFEPMGRSETYGVSLLQTSGTERYFRAGESLDGLGDIFDRGMQLNLPKESVLWSPTGKTYTFQERESLEDIEKCVRLVRSASEKYLPKYPWISSHVIGGGFWNRSYIAVTSRTAGGSDSQYQYRIFLMLTGSRDGIQQEYFQSITGVDDLSQVNEDAIYKLFEMSIERLDELLSAPVAPS